MSTDNAHFDNNPTTDYTTPMTEVPEVLFENAFEGPRGSVITIMGFPKHAGQETNIDQMMSTIAATTSNVFDKVEITHIPNVVLATKETMEKAGLTDADDAFNKPEGRVVASLIQHALITQDDIEEQARLNRWNAMTPQQQQGAIDAGREYRKLRNAEEHAASEKQRDEAAGHFFGIAQKWATLPDLSATERCHGVAHDLYQIHGISTGVNENGAYVDLSQEDRAKDYAKKYDHNFADDIRMRTIRAAKELFGNV